MQRRLAELDGARKQFVANASHELRTPIFSLGGFVELLEEEDPSPEERAEFVHTMREQIERLTKLTTDLLDLSQLDAGAIVVKADSVDLNALARDVALEFGPRADQHGSRLELRRPSRPVIARADPERVRQITRILLDNALTHTPEGTKVTVTANSVNRRVELTVSDEGPGIPQRLQGRIFERFYTAETGDGSGLGLAIARELAQRMRGRISITSNKRFTAFTLDLPPAELPAAGAESRGARVRAPVRPRRGAPGAGPPRGLRRRHRQRRRWGRHDRHDRRQGPAAGGRADLRRRLQPGPGLRRGGARRGHGALDLRRRRRRGLRLRPRRRRQDRHQRPRRHRRPDHAWAGAAEGESRLCRVPRPQRGLGEDRRLRPLRRRRPDRSRAGRARPAPARRSATTATSSSASRWRRSAAPSASSTRSRWGSSRRPTARSTR